LELYLRFGLYSILVYSGIVLDMFHCIIVTNLSFCYLNISVIWL